MGVIKQGSRTDFDIRGRWYKYAMNTYPSSRKAELDTLIARIDPSPTDLLLDAAAGDGYVARALEAYLPRENITCLDNSTLMAEEMQALFTYIISDITRIDLADESFDKITSLAAFHHVEDKQKAINELYRITKPHGLLLIADVAQGTSTQQFFDNIVDKYSVTGHNVTFSTPEELSTSYETAGFTDINKEIVNVSWEFNNIDDLSDFVFHLFGLLKTTPAAVKDAVHDYLGIDQEKNSVRMGWELMYVRGIKDEQSS